MTRDTRELDFAHHRQLFLTEQGYSYQIADGGDMICEGGLQTRARSASAGGPALALRARVEPAHAE